MSRFCIISEELKLPIDEGFKKVCYEIINILKNKHEFIFIGKHPIDIPGCLCKSIKTNKLFLNQTLFQTLNKFDPQTILYIPYSSITFASLLRSWILRLLSKRKVLVLALQPRKYPILSKYIIPFFRPDLLLALSEKSLKNYQFLNFKVKKVPLGVNIYQFKPVDGEQKKLLRRKYGCPQDRKILLHIGHLKASRNIIPLLQAVQKMDALLLLVTSTTTYFDEELKKTLFTTDNVKTIDWYVENIEEIYQLSDCYIFFVENPMGCIEMPLSVLEAMACNLPVITTKFGGLPDWFDFEPMNGLVFVSNKDELTEVIKGVTNIIPKTRVLVESFSWDEISKIIVNFSDLKN